MRYSRYILSILLILAAAMGISCAGQLSRDNAIYRQRITEERAKTLREKNAVVRVGIVLHGKNNLQEIRILKEKLQEHSLNMKVIKSRHRDYLSHMLRSGKVDVIAGELTEDTVRRWHLTPVLSYTDPDSRQCCCAVRNEDPVLTEIFGRVVPQEKDKHDRISEKKAEQQ